MKKKNIFFIYPVIILGILLFTLNSCNKNDTNTNPADINPEPGPGWSVLGNLDIPNVYAIYIDKNENLFAAALLPTATETAT